MTDIEDLTNQMIDALVGAGLIDVSMDATESARHGGYFFDGTTPDGTNVLVVVTQEEDR